MAYFVQRDEEKDILVEFNCESYQRKQLVSKQAHILSIAATEQIMVVLEDKYSMQKLVGQVAN